MLDYSHSVDVVDLLRTRLLELSLQLFGAQLAIVYGAFMLLGQVVQLAQLLTALAG